MDLDKAALALALALALAHLMVHQRPTSFGGKFRQPLYLNSLARPEHLHLPPPISDPVKRLPMSFFSMEWGNDCPYGALRPQGPLVSDEGSSSSDFRLYPLYPQVILLMELRSPPFYQLTWIFRHISLVSILLYILVLFKESPEVGRSALKASSLRYDGFLIPL